MKKLLFILAAAVMAASCGSGNGYTIKGTITGDSDKLVNGTAYLFNRDRENPIRDTADVVNGKFVFKGSVTTPESYLITIDGIPGMISLFLENANVTITTDTTFAEPVITGGPTQTLLNRYGEQAKALGDKYDIKNVIKDMRRPTSTEAERDSAMEIYGQYQEELDAAREALTAEAPVSDFALYFIMQNREYYYMTPDSLSALIAGYKALPEFAENRFIAAMDEYLQKEQSLAVGNKAPDFTLNNPDGKPVTLSEFYPKGKVTMIDFWASWCGPCRNFNPTLVKIYNKYHKLGFEIIGVSLDRDHDAWVKGIKEDKLTWTHVSDLKFWQSEVGQMYNVNFIPQNTFVDSEGNIIGRKVAEDEIETLLDEYLKK